MKKMKNISYKNVWIAFVNMGPLPNHVFTELIDMEVMDDSKYQAAWGNILIKSDLIDGVPNIVELGLLELGMEVIFIDSIQNTDTLIEYKELDLDVVEEIESFIDSTFLFKISDQIFPYF